MPIGKLSRSQRPKRARYAARWAKIEEILERTRKGRAKIDAVLAAPDDAEPLSSLPDDTPISYSPTMSLPDMDGHPAIEIDAQVYQRILLEAVRRRKSPDQTSDELVNEALDRVLAEVQSLGMHHSLTPVEPPEPRGDDLAGFKRAHILRVLAACEGNITQAAERLGVARSTLQRKMKALYVEPTTTLPEKGQTSDTPARADATESKSAAETPVPEPDATRGAPRQQGNGSISQLAAPAVTSSRAPCDYRTGGCPNTLRWRGSLRCGCPRPSRSAA